MSESVEYSVNPSGNDALMDGAEEGDLQLDATSPHVIMEKNDRSVHEFYRWYKNKRLILDPEWQRNYVWARKAASRLIESFLTDIPVPVVYLGKNEEGTYEVIDGLQRLTSVFRFLDGEFQLTGLEIMTALNGKDFSSLEQKYQNKLWDVTLRAYELSPATPKELMFVIFERLNTGGTALNDMEIRNCLFRGELNRLLRDLAENSDFATCVNQPNLRRRMTDRLLVLRFLAFYERTYQKATRGLKKFFNEFFEVYRNPPSEKLREFEMQFKKAMRASVTVFGDYGFRLRRTDVRGSGEWTPRVNASIFQVLAVSFTKYDLAQITRAADCILEEYLDLLSRDQNWIDCISRTTGDTERIVYAFETWFSRLAELMKSIDPTDSKRCFSRSLKQEIFSQSSVCSICGQNIRLLNDSALDHDEHYWRGGKTIPSNARLVHRLCNLKRSL